MAAPPDGPDAAAACSAAAGANTNDGGQIRKGCGSHPLWLFTASSLTYTMALAQEAWWIAEMPSSLGAVLVG
ncbi:hypothetical protein MUG91_G160n29 [Manis pentadactyla]|nr:hypothetical protein MUG91_G160n29 [Manis pentadactyla]